MAEMSNQKKFIRLKREKKRKELESDFRQKSGGDMIQRGDAFMEQMKSENIEFNIGEACRRLSMVTTGLRLKIDENLKNVRALKNFFADAGMVEQRANSANTDEGQPKTLQNVEGMESASEYEQPTKTKVSFSDDVADVVALHPYDDLMTKEILETSETSTDKEAEKESATEVEKESATEVEKESATETEEESATEAEKESATEVEKESATEVENEKEIDLEKRIKNEDIENESYSESKKNMAKVDITGEKRRFINYINSTLRDYLKAHGKPILPHHEFKGDFENLESFCEVLVKEKVGCFVNEYMRINPKKYLTGYLSMSKDRNSMEPDALVPFPAARSQAMDGDLVNAFVFNSFSSETTRNRLRLRSQSSGTAENSEENSLQSYGGLKKCFVINIIKKIANRTIVGKINLVNTVTKNKVVYFIVYPTNPRSPHVHIEKTKCLKFFNDNSIYIRDTSREKYVEATIESVYEFGIFIGSIKQFLGIDGVLKDDIQAILTSHNLGIIKHFNDKFEDTAPLIITENDLKSRIDLREKCIFTIDPITAKDLDDALSIERLPTGNYEVGIHISDVTYFLPENSELDNIVKLRATSVYLPTEVFEMLPASLTQKCSLLPRQDKFAVSVFQTITPHGKLRGKPRICRTVVRSCTKLAYEHAQYILDYPHSIIQPDDFPDIEKFTFLNIRQKILIFNSIAKHMRAKRFKKGALTIDNSKLYVHFDSDTGKPINYGIENRKDANFLIEEYMLLANRIVAKFIFEKFPSTSILRKHEEPLGRSLAKVDEKLKSHGYHLDMSSSKALQDSIRTVCFASPMPEAMYIFLCSNLRKSLSRAKYFCTEKCQKDDMKHYALSVPFYTHFTSPIRRYADILVHRNVIAALGLGEKTKRSPDDLKELAQICNEQAYRAKCAGEDALEVCFYHYIESKQFLVRSAIVCALRDDSMEVVDMESGHCLPVYFDSHNFEVIGVNKIPYYIMLKQRSLEFIIKLFSVVSIKMFLDKYKKLSAELYIPALKNNV